MIPTCDQDLLSLPVIPIRNLNGMAGLGLHIWALLLDLYRHMAGVPCERTDSVSVAALSLAPEVSLVVSIFRPPC